MKLYEVTVEYRLFVVASDREAAETWATEHVHEWCRDEAPTDAYGRATAGCRVSPSDGRSLPWNGDGVRTVAEVIAEETRDE